MKFIQYKRPRLSNKAWISLDEVPRYVDLVVIMTNQGNLRLSFEKVSRRILKLIKRGSFKTTFLYLKEVQRIVIKYLSGDPDMGLNTPFVKKDRLGLPLILPLQLRTILREGTNYRAISAIMTLLSIYRTFNVQVAPTLGTVTGPFEGTSRTLDEKLVQLALKNLGIEKLDLRKQRFIILESAGPNSSPST